MTCSTADKQFVVCDPQKRTCMQTHKSDPACIDHRLRRPTGVKHGHGASKRAREAAQEKAARPRQGQGSRSGASTSWDQAAFRPRAERRQMEESEASESGEEDAAEGAAEEESEDEDEDEDDMFG